MVLMVFLLYLSTSKGQNEEIRTEDFINFSNPIDQLENKQSQNINLFIQQYLNFNDDISQESDNHADIQAQEQNNIDSDLFCEIPCDSSLMNIENIPSTSLFDPTSDHKPLYDANESFLGSTSFETHNLTIGASVSSFEPECECVGLCLCITTPKPDNTTLDIDSAARIDSNILSSDIVLTNKKNQQDDITNKTFLQSELCQINSEVEANLNSTEQSNEQTTYQDTKENILSPVQSNIITSLSHISYNPNHTVPIIKKYLDYEKKMAEASRVQANFVAKCEEIQSIVQPSTSREVLILGLKAAIKRKYPAEKNEIDESKTVNESMKVKSLKSFHSEGSQKCSNTSENEPKINQNKILYDHESKDTHNELSVHFENCDYYADPQMKRLIIEIYYKNSEVKKIIYDKINLIGNIPKTEKSKEILYIFGTYKTYPSKGGSSFTVRVPKKFEDEDQFENSDSPLASGFVPITTTNEYNLTLIMSCYNKKMKLTSAYFISNNVAEHVPSRFYAYHFKQVIRFEINRRVNDRVFYHFEYKPEKEV